MKKITILSLVSALTITNFANAHVENPLYVPTKGKFYSKSGFEKAKSVLQVNGDVGYGITNRYSMSLGLGYQEDLDSTKDGFTNVRIGGNYRLLNNRALVSDIFAKYAKSLDKEVAGQYQEIDAGWKVGTQRKGFTVAGSVRFNRVVMKNKADNDSNNIGINGNFAFNINERYSSQIEVDYLLTDDFNTRTGTKDNSFLVKAQVNYIRNGLWSLYYQRDLGVKNSSGGLGLKYGIQF